MTPLPKIAELFDFTDMNPVLKAFLAKLKSLYGYWYPADEQGDVDRDKTREYFLAFQKELGGDDLAGLMPPMCHQPVKGSEPYMLLAAYDPKEHTSKDIKNEIDFKKKRAPLGSTHDDIRNFGSDILFGGLECRFEPRSVIKPPLYTGRKCTFRASAEVAASLIGDETLLNTGSLCVGTILGSGSRVDGNSVVKYSLIGREVFIMGGVQLLHRKRLKLSEITVRDFRDGSHGETDIPTGRLKMGAVIGDGCVVGANAVLGPGTILMPGCDVPNGMVLASGIYDQQAIYALDQAHHR